MKFLAFLIITTILAISNSELSYKPAPNEINCPLLPVKNNSQTVLFDMDANAHPEIKTCILQTSLSDKSVVLWDVYGTDIGIRLNVTRRIGTNKTPNVIIMTKYLTLKMVDSIWQFFIKSYWSLLYIIVTGDKKFNCNNGTMDTNDFLLLENIMNTLWHRLQIMRVGVVFPLACEQKMIIYNGKRPSTRGLYDRSIKLINATKFNEIFANLKQSGHNLAVDYPVRGNTFYRYPTAIKDCGNLHYFVNFDLNVTYGYCGLDGMVMYDILTHLKFNLSFIDDDNCNVYGYGAPGNVSGILGCIVRNEVDVSFNSRFMTKYSNEHVHYLHYVTTDKLCALIKKPDVIPLWQGVFNLYSAPLWTLIVAVVIAIGGIMWVTAMINKSMTRLETTTIWGYVLNSVESTLFGLSPMKTRAILMIRMSCLMGSMFFLAIYQGHISRVYTTVEHYPQMKTLQDLYSSGDTLYTSASMRAIMNQLQDPNDKIEQKFFERSQLTQADRLGIVIQYPHAATVDRKSDAVMGILEQYSDSRGYPLIDILDQCFYTYYLSCIARSGFPFYEELQKFIERLNEAGLPSMYYKWTQNMLEIRGKIPKNTRESRSFSKIRLEDQLVAFGILFTGTIVSVIVFAAELWQGGRRRSLKLSNRRS